MRRVLITAGVITIGIGLTGVLRDPSVGVLPYFRFLVVSLIFADAFVMPFALAAGAFAARALPGWLRVPVQGALYASAAVTLVALPLMLGYGRDPALPSALPRNYPLGLLIVLAVIWLAALIVAVVRRAGLVERAAPVRRAGGPRTGTRP